MHLIHRKMYNVSQTLFLYGIIGPVLNKSIDNLNKILRVQHGIAVCVMCFPTGVSNPSILSRPWLGALQI